MAITIDGVPGMPIRMSGHSGIVGVSGTTLPSVTIRVDPDQELKKLLQKTILDECSDLLLHYNFRIVRLVAEHNHYKDCYSFAVGISSPCVENGNALSVSYDLSRHVSYDLSRYSSSQSIACSLTFFMQAFHLLAKNLRREIEQRTKDMPMPNPFYASSTSESISSNGYRISQGLGVIPNQIGEVMWNTINTETMQQVQSFTNPRSKKKSKFEFIDKLIEESRQRLIGHAKPQFAFEYF